MRAAGQPAFARAVLVTKPLQMKCRSRALQGYGARVRRPLKPGDAVTWVGARLPPPDVDLVNPGERGIFRDFDGSPDSYVVEFPGGGVFCCHPSDVEPDLNFDEVHRRHHGNYLANPGRLPASWSHASHT